jgi:predicted Zn-dependent peptidase
LFYIGGELLNSTSRKYIYNLIRKDVKKYCKNISERDLTKVKNQYLLDFYHGLQTNHGVANYLGNMEFYLGDFTAYQKEIEIYQNVKLDEVIQLCEKVFDFNNAIYMTVWDKNKTRLKI